MEEVHQEAIKCLIDPNRDRTTLTQKLLDVDVDKLNNCMRGYWYLYHAELLGMPQDYSSAFENWRKHLGVINENEKNNLLKMSDNCFWNLQLADIIKKSGGDYKNYYLNTLSFGNKTIKLMREYNDYKGELTHLLFVGYASIMCDNPEAPTKDFVETISQLIELHPDLNHSLVAEAKAVQGIVGRVGSKEEIKSHLFGGFYKHLLYLHKKRCKNLMEHLEL